jgi:serine phosphatase RsbU (regulator of sigma subunit)/anti-sigma regulatory factor (Ser/Thr protein kinase)
MSTITLPFRNLLRRKPAALPLPPTVDRTASILPAVEVPPTDPLYALCVSAPGVIDLDELRLASDAVTGLRAAGIRLIIPLVNQGELIGMVQLGGRMSDQEYTSDDLRLLGNLAPQAAAALRVAQLAYQQQLEARRRERIEQEIRVAGIIQQTLLPKDVPHIEAWEFAAWWQPARTVGGDFYDFVPLHDGRLMVVIGDVTDKGVPAALVMASTRTILRAAAERLISPGEILRRANDVLQPDMPPKMFVTCLCAVLDPQTGHLVYANAGHNAALQRTRDGVKELRARGMPLGLMPGMSYEEKETQLAPDDTVFMYSDGLVEAHDGAREMFGMKRLESLIADHDGGEGLIPHLRDALFAFAGADWEQEDDVTFVVVQRQHGAPPSDPPDDASVILDDFEATSVPGGERPVMERVAAVVNRVGLPAARIERLKTAVAETVMNAMEHGNHYRADQPVRVRVQTQGGQLSVFITDQGGDQPIVDAPAPDLEAKLAGTQSARGWGLFLIKAMVDDMLIHTTPTEHTVQLVFHLPGGNDAR